MGTVQRIAGLESDNFTPPKLAEIGTQLVWRVTPAPKIIMHRLLNADYRATQINGSGLLMQIVHSRMRAVIGAENLRGLMGFVGGPIVGDSHRSKNDPLLIAKGDILTKRQALGEGRSDIKGYRHGPKLAISKTHICQNRQVIGFAEKPLQRCKTAIHQQFEITYLTGGQIPTGQICSVKLELLRRLVRHIKFRDWHQILQIHFFVFTFYKIILPPICREDNPQTRH